MWRDHLARHTPSVGLVNYIRREVLASRVMKRTEFRFFIWNATDRSAPNSQFPRHIAQLPRSVFCRNLQICCVCP